MGLEHQFSGYVFNLLHSMTALGPEAGPVEYLRQGALLPWLLSRGSSSDHSIQASGRRIQDAV